MEEKIICKICGYSTPISLQAHINRSHNLNNKQYWDKFPGALIYSKAYGERLQYTNAHRDPSYKKKLSENTLKLYQDAEWVKYHNEQLKIAQSSESARINHRKGAIKHFSDRTEEQIKVRIEGCKKSWKCAKTRENRVSALKESHRSLEGRLSHSKATRIYYEGLTEIERDEKRKKLRETWAKPELREKILRLSKVGLQKAMSPEGRKNFYEAKARSLRNIKYVSSLNNRFKKALNESGFYPEPEQVVGSYIVDFLFRDQKIIVEVDGDYWHGNPLKYKEFDSIQEKKRNRDLAEAEYCSLNGYLLIRFWETDINQDLCRCLKKVQDIVQSTVEQK